MAALPVIEVRVTSTVLPPHFRFRTNAFGRLILQHRAEASVWSAMDERYEPKRTWRDAKAEDLNDFFNPKEPT